MKYSKAKVGEVVSTTLYMTITDKPADAIEVHDSHGRTFTVKGRTFIESTMTSSEQFTKEEKVSRTELANIFTNAGDSVFKVEFVTAKGEDRTLIGHLRDSENNMGRSSVIDLEIKSTNPQDKIRQVDHRTLKSLILKGVKYSVKK